MNTVPVNVSIEREFGPVLEQGEKTIWAGRPNFLAFIANGIPILLFGLAWGYMDYALMGKVFSSGNVDGGFMVVFTCLHLMPLWVGVLNMIRLLLTYRNTVYLVTDRRLVYRGGFFGIDMRSVDYEKIQDLEVNINPIEKMLSVGSIRAGMAIMGYAGRPQVHKFVGIASPYEVFKKIKELSTRNRENGLVI